MTAKLVWIDAITQRPAIRWRTSRSASRRESDSKRSARSSPRPIVLPSRMPETESDSCTTLEMSASVSCVVFAIRRRWLPTRRVSRAKNGIRANANSASCQLNRSMPIIVATTVVTFEVIDVAVFVTTFCTPPMSFWMRDCTSPVRVFVKNASDSRCRWRKTLARRSCITRWPTWLDSSVWKTPSTPVTIAIAIIPAAASDSSVVSLRPIASSARLSRNAGRTPRPAETTIRTSTPLSRIRYGANRELMRRRFARRRAGSAGRSGATSEVCQKALTLLARAPYECADDRLELMAALREPVLDRGRAGVEHAPLEQARLDELRQARGQRRRRNAPERVAELVEARCPVDRRVEDREGPAPLEEVRRAADLLGNRLTPRAAHGRTWARARAAAPRRRSAPGGS